MTQDGMKGGADGIRKLLPGIMRGETMRGETRPKGGFGVVFSHGLPGPGYTGRTKEVWIGGGGGGITEERCAETGGQGGIPCGALFDSRSLYCHNCCVLGGGGPAHQATDCYIGTILCTSLQSFCFVKQY